MMSNGYIQPAFRYIKINIGFKYLGRFLIAQSLVAIFDAKLIMTTTLTEFLPSNHILKALGEFTQIMKGGEETEEIDEVVAVFKTQLLAKSIRYIRSLFEKYSAHRRRVQQMKGQQVELAVAVVLFLGLSDVCEEGVFFHGINWAQVFRKIRILIVERSENRHDVLYRTDKARHANSFSKIA